MSTFDRDRLPALGAPITIQLYIDFEIIDNYRDFIIPFKLVTRDEYLFWLYGVFAEVLRVFGLNEHQYLLTYLRTGKEAANEWLTAARLTPTSTERVLWHCKCIAEKVLRCGVHASAFGNGVWLLDGWRESHSRNFQFSASQFVGFLTKWGNQVRSDIANGAQNSLKTMSYYEAHNFTLNEFHFMMYFGTHVGNHKRAVKEYFFRLNVTSINLADRVTEDFPEDHAIYESSEATFIGSTGVETPEAKGLLSTNKGVQCAHCHKPNHEEDECWVKFPHLKKNSRKKRKATDDDCKASKKSKSSQKSSKKGSSEAEPSGDSESDETGLGLKTNFVWATGSEVHIVNDRNLLFDFVKQPQPLTDIGGKETCISEGYGKVKGRAVTGAQVVLEKVFYVKESHSNVISGIQVVQNLAVDFNQGTLTLTDQKGRRVDDPEETATVVVPINCERSESPQESTKSEKKLLRQRPILVTTPWMLGGISQQ